MAATSGAELIAVAFAALAPYEQEQAFARINDIRLTRVAAQEGETALSERRDVVKRGDQWVITKPGVGRISQIRPPR